MFRATTAPPHRRFGGDRDNLPGRGKVLELSEDDVRLLRRHTVGRATSAGVPVREVRIHQAGSTAFFSVQTESAEKTFVFDTLALKSFARILRVVEHAEKGTAGQHMPRLYFDADGSLHLEE
jgi:hypothetical protein